MGGGRDKWTDLHTNAANFRVLCRFIGNAKKKKKTGQCRLMQKGNNNEKQIWKIMSCWEESIVSITI